MHHCMYTKSPIKYSSKTFRCSLTPSSGSPVSLQVLWSTSNDYKHLLASSLIRMSPTHQWRSFYDNIKSCVFCFENCDLITCGQYVLVIILGISKDLQLNGAPWRRCQWKLKRIGTIFKMCSNIHRMVPNRWSIKGDMTMMCGVYSVTMNFTDLFSHCRRTWSTWS
jgi:hypothetical protein